MDYSTTTSFKNLKWQSKQPKGVAAFIGAGCSSALNIPRWDDLLIGLNKEFPYYLTEKELKDALGKVGYSQVASNIRTKADAAKFRDLVRKFTKPSACYFTSLHIEIVQFSKTITTTNYDESFEETNAALLRCNPECEYWKAKSFSIGNLDIFGIGVNRHIYHIHGMSSTGEIVLTEESYFDQYQKEHSGVRAFITSLFSSFSNVFIGFSFEDKNFMNFLENAWETITEEKKYAAVSLPQHYCILSDNHKKDYFTIRDLELNGDELNEWINKGLILEDKTTVPDVTVYHPVENFVGLLKADGYDEEKQAKLVKIFDTMQRNQEKLKQLQRLNIEVIYFEGSDYLEIELILRGLNATPEPASANEYIPD